MKKKIIRIIILIIFVGLIGFRIHQRGQVLGTRADVVGNLLFTYPGGTTPETLFNETDFKPGDCEETVVNVLNQSTANSIVGVFSDGEFESDGLSQALEITISDGFNPPFYGPVSLAQFFADSDVLNEINLLTLAGNAKVELHFKVCFPDTDDNELQGDSVNFDLKFGQIKPPIELPAVCDSLESIVTEKIVGTTGNDNIKGTSASELIIGKSGNDKIDGGGGHDCIIGGDGKDKIEGGSGNDIITGNKGDDKISGGSGNDVIYGGDGTDKIDGGSGNDKIYAGKGDDKIEGGSGNDLVYAGADNDKVWGGAGDDDLYGQAGDDNIKGDSGDDYLHGGPGTDKLDGNSGTDKCVSGESLTSCEL